MPVLPLTLMPAHTWTFVGCLALGLGRGASPSFLQQKRTMRFHLYTTFAGVYNVLKSVFPVLQSPFISLYLVLFPYELTIGTPSECPS